MQRLQQGIGSMLASRPLGSGGQFGQLQGSSGPRTPSLEEVLAERGFQMPERPTGVGHQAMVMYKDPVTGENRTGGAHAASHANSLSDFYGQNPEALEVAKQYNTDPTQFERSPGIHAFGKSAPTKVLQQEMPRVLGNQPQQFQGPSLDPAQQQQELAALSSAQARAAGMPPPQPVQEFQPIQRPSVQSLQQPMGQQQPQFTQQDMSGMMRLMMQMFQQMMQSNQGQQSYNSGAFNNAPSNFYPQYPSAPQQTYAPPPQRFAPQRYQAPRSQPYRMRQATRFAGSPFGR